MKIKLITPASAKAPTGNRITAVRWARILKQLGHHVTVEQLYDGRPCDLLIALHALHSYESIHRYREKYPRSPLIVVLTGTDLYRDIRTNSHAQQSLKLATRLIVLQVKGMDELPRYLHRKTRVIYQSAAPVNGRASDAEKVFKVCVIGHLRPEKDPFRTAMATRDLPSSSRVRVLHIGRALSSEMRERAREEAARNPRYRWLKELPHWKARRVLAQSHVLSLTSRMEGSSNVLSEAIASSVPVIASSIGGLMGTLGANYPGYFPVGNTRALARLLRKVEFDPGFYLELKRHCTSLFPLVDPKRERQSWKELLRELSQY
ncbi:MAG: selenoneine biosynthesis selenosugar synthase SenB [Candidatus Binatia bacterium]